MAWQSRLKARGLVPPCHALPTARTPAPARLPARGRHARPRLLAATPGRLPASPATPARLPARRAYPPRLPPAEASARGSRSGLARRRREDELVCTVDPMKEKAHLIGLHNKIPTKF